MTGVSRFDCYPSDFLNGIIGLSSDEIAAYTVVMMLQYDRGEPVAYVGRERELSVRSGLPKGRLSKAISELIRIGKLTLTEGALQNGRTAQELEKINERIRKNGENSSSGGEATRAKWEQIRNENNDGSGPNGKPPGKPKQGPISPPSSLPPPPIDPSPPSEHTREEGGGGEFEKFWKGFPKAPTASRPKARLAFEELTPDDQAKAIGYLPAFSVHVAAKPTSHPMSPETYLRDRIFENFELGPRVVSSLVRVERDSPEGEAWDAHYRVVKGKPPPWTNNAWQFSTQWPPKTPDLVLVRPP